MEKCGTLGKMKTFRLFFLAWKGWLPPTGKLGLRRKQTEIKGEEQRHDGTSSMKEKKMLTKICVFFHFHWCFETLMFDSLFFSQIRCFSQTHRIHVWYTVFTCIYKKDQPVMQVNKKTVPWVLERYPATFNSWLTHQVGRWVRSALERSFLGDGCWRGEGYLPSLKLR